MKTIIFACAVIFFTSCSKKDINLDVSTWNSPVITITGDSSNKVKADIDVNGTTSHLSAVALQTSFSRYFMTLNVDSSIVTIYGRDTSIAVQIDLINVRTPGTYKFGRNPAYNQEVKASCFLHDPIGGYGTINYYNDANLLSGSITIDNFTSKHIQGSFTVTCLKGTAAANITNGNFTGNF